MALVEGTEGLTSARARDTSRSLSEALGVTRGGASPLASTIALGGASDIGAVGGVNFSSVRRFEDADTNPFNVPPEFVELGAARRAATTALTANQSVREDVQDLRRAVDDAATEGDENAAVLGDARARILGALGNIDAAVRGAESPDGVNLLNGSRPEGFRVTQREVPAGDTVNARPSQDTLVVDAGNLEQAARGLRAALSALSFEEPDARERANNAISEFEATLELNRIQLSNALDQISVAETRRLETTDAQASVLNSLSLGSQVQSDAERLRDFLQAANPSGIVTLALSGQGDPRASSAGQASVSAAQQNATSISA